MSKYPSAYGHTPSYRSVGSMPSASSTIYPSALGSRDSDLSFRVSMPSSTIYPSALGSRDSDLSLRVIFYV